MSPSRSAWVRTRTISSSREVDLAELAVLALDLAVSRSFSRRSRAASAACCTVPISSCWCQGFAMIRKTSPELTACRATRKSSAAVQRIRTAEGTLARACLEEADAVHPRHHVVGDDDDRAVRLDRLERALGSDVAARLEPRGLEDPAEGLQDELVVVDDEDAVVGDAGDRRVGRREPQVHRSRMIARRTRRRTGAPRRGPEVGRTRGPSRTPRSSRGTRRSSRTRRAS